MPSATALRSSVAGGAILRVAVAAAGILGAAHSASAQSYFWREMEPSYYYYQQHPAMHPPRQQQRARRAAPKKEVIKDTAVHPQMPLIINVSIAKQQVRVYDANGLFAEAPVSTGMPGHPTPMGVFSVIQKDRYHHSNIYSGAPMPFMQRITWGGVALHAGVLPGYPASHGCIRMPESFAIKMWGWTKMGARVIVTPGELSPSGFSHPLLPAMKVVPQPVVAEQPETNDPVGAKADKGAPELKPIEANLELRSSVGRGDVAALRDQTRTADASGNARGKDATMSDASSANNSPAPEATTPRADDGRPEANADSAPQASADTVGRDTRRADATDAEKSAAPADPKSADVADAKPAETTSVKPAEAKTSEAKPDASRAETAKADSAKPTDKPADPKAAKAVITPAMATDAKKDQTRLAEPPKPAAKAEKRREGQVAVFISRKDSKLYVRQNFAPLFEAPVTIAPSDRPFGTHVFTAAVDKDDSNILHWSVVTVPISARAAMRDSDMPRTSRRHKGKNPPPPVEAKPAPVPNSPAEALDRITIPADAMARISEALATGGSIIVSDQGINQGETGEYTDFIVRTY